MRGGRRWLGYALVAFAVFYLFTRPAEAAAAVQGVFNGVMQSADRLSVFFGALAG
ncbi:hypothetical protein AB0K05_13015 [Nonomuraea sp. NPDC049486]|uniref:hypothetical protein n=1 Tax=Nonomuraea sp. NPDC049486 TaxID=3155773 RepID=UPI003445F75D